MPPNMKRDVPTARSPVVLSLAITLALFVPHSQARAQVRLCHSEPINMRDRDRLRAAMQQALPAGVNADGIPDLCIGPHYGVASLDTTPRLRADGAVEQWTLTCMRNASWGNSDWTCTPPTHELLIWVYTDIKGIQRRLEVSFNDATGLTRARSLSVRAEQMFQDETAEPPPACPTPGTSASDKAQRERDRSRWREQQVSQALTPQDTVIALTIDSNKPGVFYVTNDAEGLVLTFTEVNDRSAAEQVCWAEQIVITGTRVRTSRAH